MHGAMVCLNLLVNKLKLDRLAYVQEAGVAFSYIQSREVLRRYGGSWSVHDEELCALSPVCWSGSDPSQAASRMLLSCCFLYGIYGCSECNIACDQ